MIKISQAMIVRNEEKNIKRALSWGKEIVFEQIVIDTGSTDGTIEIARSMGARVYSFKWIDDFSCAKNYAISKCSGDWIAFLDADEYFTETDIKKIPEILSDIEKFHPSSDAVFSSLWNLDSEGKAVSGGSQIRLFRRKDSLRYYRPIHEQLRHLNGDILKTVDLSLELTIMHTGYQDEILRKKYEENRNLNLLKKEILKYPKDSELLGYLGDEYLGYASFLKNSGKKEEAKQSIIDSEEAYRKAILYSKGKEDLLSVRLSSCYVNLIRILSEDDNRGDELIAISKEAMKRLPEDADFPYLLGCFYFSGKDFEKAQEYLSKAISTYEKFGALNKATSLKLQFFYALEMLADALLFSGRTKEAVQMAVEILNSKRDALPALRTLFSAFKRENVSGEEALSFLSKLYDIENSYDKAIIIRAAADTEYEDLYNLLKQAIKGQ